MASKRCCRLACEYGVVSILYVERAREDASPFVWLRCFCACLVPHVCLAALCCARCLCCVVVNV